MHRSAADQAGALTDGGLLRGLGALAAAEVRERVSARPWHPKDGFVADLAGAVGVLVTIVATATGTDEVAVIDDHRQAVALDPFLDSGSRSRARIGFAVVATHLGVEEPRAVSAVDAVAGVHTAARHLYPDVVALSAHARTPVEALLDLIGILATGR